MSAYKGLLLGLGASILVVGSLCAVTTLTQSHKEEPVRVSKNFVHKSTEVLNSDEKVETYMDYNNENLCYFYYFDNEKQASLMICVKQKSSLDFP